MASNSILNIKVNGEWVEVPCLKGEPGNDGTTPNLTIGTVETLPSGSEATATITGDKENPVLNLGIPKGADGQGDNNYNSSFRWKKVGIYHPGCQYGIKSKSVYSVAAQYTALSYELNGEKLIKFSGACGGSSDRCAYAFVDENNNDLGHSEWVSMKTFSNIVLQVPENAKKVFINGNGYESPYLEVAVEDSMGDMHNTQYLLNEFGKRLQYKDEFQWKPMPTGLVAFTFDDSIDTTYSIVDLFIRKGVPCCFGAIPSKLYMSLSNGETIAQAMQRGIDEVDCEVLAHGGYIVTEANVNDENYLFEKFVTYKQKLVGAGFNVRGIVRTGGSDDLGNENLCGDKRTDEWCRLFFDYGDLYGINEPYNHPRVSVSTEDGYKQAIDDAVQNKGFASLLFHQPPDYLERLIDYAISKGALICNYSYAYDTYGSTKNEVRMLNRIASLEENAGISSKEEKQLIRIVASKTKVEYLTNEIFSTNDITVTATYSDGTTEDVTESSTINTDSVKSKEEGEYTIIVSYGGFERKITVTFTYTDEPTVYDGTILLDNVSFSGEELTASTAFGPTVSVVNGKNYILEADYNFTTTVQYSQHWINLKGIWSQELVKITTEEGTTSGHLSLSVECTNTSKTGNLFTSITMQNTAVTAYEFTNVTFVEMNTTTGEQQPTLSVPQTGTWQLKTTTGKKYIILGTDDDNSGNAKYFRLLRTYGFPYTMNVEAENASKTKALGSDVDDTIFTSDDAPALFPDGVDVITLGKYLHDNNLGEVAQHGASSKVLWDSERLTGDFLTSLHTSYVEQGGTKTEEELKAAIMEQLADTDGSQGAVYVDNSRSTLEEVYGFPIYTVGVWGGVPTATVDGIECSMNNIKGTSNYDWRAKNYTAVGTLVGQFRTNTSTYDLSRMACGVDDVHSYIDRIEAGKVCEFFCHMPFNDEPDISKWRALFNYIKSLVDSGKAEVVTRKQYAELGEYVDNPITKIAISRDNIPVGETDIDSAYIITATYADSTTADVTTEAILDRSAVNTETVGNYTVSATYRGFNTTSTVTVFNNNYTVPDGLKDTDYWFVFKNNTQNKMFCGNTTGTFGSASSSAGKLIFINCASGLLNGWESTDDGATWIQVNTNTSHSKNIKTSPTEDTVYNFNFGSAAKDIITFLETSGNFEITYTA